MTVMEQGCIFYDNSKFTPSKSHLKIIEILPKKMVKITQKPLKNIQNP